MNDSKVNKSNFLLYEGEELEVLSTSSNSEVLIELVRIHTPNGYRPEHRIRPFIIRIHQMKDGVFIRDLMSTQLATKSESLIRLDILSHLLRTQVTN